jgi:cold shock CspA family protein
VELQNDHLSGKMLWFDERRDHGFIFTDDGERLYVHRDGFVDGAPVGRCAGLPVRLEIGERDGERAAVNVTLLPEAQHGRARRRTGGRSARY